MVDEPRATRFGPYESLRLLGAGGTGQVFLAWHRGLRRQVALKILAAHVSLDPEAVRRFRREARSAVALSHPNLVKVYDAGEHEGVEYIAMEYVEGQTLAARLAAEGPLPACECLRLACAILDGLRECHRAGMLHRDLKPANVALDRAQVPRIADFGLVKQDESSLLTPEGALVGSPRYMPPETLDGAGATVLSTAPRKKVDISCPCPCP